MKKLSFSNRAKDIFTLFSGTAISQLISVVGTFFLTSLYFPEDFGVYASFLSLVNIIAIGLNLRYEMAIILPKNRINAIQLVYLCFLISILLIIIGFFFSFLLPNDFGNFSFLNNSSFEGISQILPYAIPVLITAWFISNFNVLNYYSVRNGDFKTISKALLLKALFVLVFQVLLFYLFKGATGLIIGQLVGIGVALMYFIVTYLKDFRKIKFNYLRTWVLRKRYIDFVKYTFPGALANTLSLELNSIFILTYFASTEAGFYFLSIKLLGAPLALIGKSYSQVYLRDATEERRVTGKANIVFLKVLKELTVFSIILIIFGGLFIVDIITLIFGEKWSEAGSYSIVLLPLYMIRLISSSLSGTMTVFEKQKVMLFNNIVLLSVLIIVYFITNYFKLDVYNFLVLYTSFYSLIYISFIFIYYQTTLNKLAK